MAMTRGGIGFERIERMMWHELIEHWGIARLMGGYRPEE